MYNASILTLFLIGGLIASILGIYAPKLCAKLGLLDVPTERKKHRFITPLLGGLAIQFAFLPSAIFLALFVVQKDYVLSTLMWLGAVSGMSLIGLADDRHSLSPRDRLLVSFVIFGSASILDPIFNVRIVSFEHPQFSFGLGTSITAVIFTSICCVGFVNAVNMADGKNGLVIGLCLGWLAILGTRAPDYILPYIVLLLIILTILFIFNLMGKIFLGDGGSYGLASAIGLLVIIMYNTPGAHAGGLVSAEEVIILFLTPVFDACRVSYKRTKDKKSPMVADRDHLHHHLQDRFGWPQGLVIYWIIALSPAMIVFVFF
jgi:UDP-GlcNAc:undecaprenyl-phosphate/decaprenyl-phosphate GlcNAc-1-phosphate transferase